MEETVLDGDYELEPLLGSVVTHSFRIGFLFLCWIFCLRILCSFCHVIMHACTDSLLNASLWQVQISWVFVRLPCSSLQVCFVDSDRYLQMQHRCVHCSFMPVLCFWKKQLIKVISIFYIKCFWPEWYISTICHCRDLPFWSETLSMYTHTNTHTHYWAMLILNNAFFVMLFFSYLSVWVPLCFPKPLT